MSLDVFFNPRSVAVIGASRDPRKGANQILLNLLQAKKKLNLYPINPNAEEIMGLKAYHSVLDIPEPVDLAIFFINQREMRKAIDECVEKGIKAFLIESGGFEEVGGEGPELAQYIKKIADVHGIKVWGPNCMGYFDSGGITTTFMLVEKVRKGNVGLISQSGMFLGGYFRHLTTKNVFGFSKVLTIGNKMGVNEIEALEFLRDDPDTKVIGIYLEGISDVRKFTELIREINRTKPIIILKGALTDQGKIAAKSHTGAIAGKRELFYSVINQAGAIHANDFKEFFEIVATFALFDENQVKVTSHTQDCQIITLSGGVGVIGSDIFSLKGHRLATLTDETMERLKRIYPFWMQPVNNGPIDIWPAIERNGIKAYYEGIDAILKDPNVAGLLLTTFGMMEYKHSGEIIEIYKKNKKPMVMLIAFGDYRRFERLRKIFESKGGIPVFNSVSAAATALISYIRYKKRFEA